LFGLFDADFAAADGILFIVQILPQHLFIVIRDMDIAHSGTWAASKFVNHFRQDHGMFELSKCEYFKYAGDVPVNNTCEHGGMVDVLDCRCLFQLKIHIEQ
jgi:hypothetical protein